MSFIRTWCYHPQCNVEVKNGIVSDYFKILFMVRLLNGSFNLISTLLLLIFDPYKRY